MRLSIQHSASIKRLVLLVACVLGLFFSHTAEAQLRVRVSIKFILGSSGQRPSIGGGGFGSSSYALTSDSAVISNINYANELLTRMGRGYQYQLTEIQDVSGWSGFFSISARDQGNKEDLEAVATSNATTRAQFFYRSDAINIYINNSSSGYCSFPGGGTIIFAGSQAYDTLMIHEMGHYMSLAHTHNGEQFRDSDNSSCSAANCSCAILIPGTTDGFADTLPDIDCWTRSQMVAANPGATTTQIDNTFLNIMSYHTPQDRFTSDQFDAWTDGANSPRFSVLTGRTRFVATSGSDTTGTGSSGSRFRTLVKGVTIANSGDIVLLRAGSYNETTTITKAVTLRATRGTAVIGL